MGYIKSYQHIFFDLDHTLWDYERNSTEVLEELVKKHRLTDRGIPSALEFSQTFEKVNQVLWSDFNKNKISRSAIRDQRFLKILANYQIEDNVLCNKLSDEYLMQCPTKPHVLPYTFEMLDYLKEKYHLHIITNGFDDVQYLKLDKSRLKPYFKTVVTSDSAGYKKPMASIFKFAIDKAEARKEESIMIGDNLQTDMLGARNFGMDHIYYNPSKLRHQASVTHEISCLSDLQHIL
ncbi:YjjG family noncanonical pyrimidine nucleotidase [Marivirga sp. S37H4]|uniref:YjjG family noncanonical pyrimidine nucleotidase n=1 Tax=Marivirga aurantiaca TaxID=2802615 RepID=A0A934X1W5_9BACT|nr:YjjG family noncanonical pyrimidine nucleotidase [Marivirga aurantiaca]MBK6267169.1 YjjG family noncanonical pyrimidine nucleotidase [Marivirga aurantiaca]